MRNLPKYRETLLSETDRNFTEISRNFTEISRNLPKLTEISRNRFRALVQTLTSTLPVFGSNFPFKWSFYFCDFALNFAKFGQFQNKKFRFFSKFRETLISETDRNFVKFYETDRNFAKQISSFGANPNCNPSSFWLKLPLQNAGNTFTDRISLATLLWRCFYIELQTRTRRPQEWYTIVSKVLNSNWTDQSLLCSIARWKPFFCQISNFFIIDLL